MITVQEFFEESRRTLSPSERFHLATLLLNDIPPHSVVDYSTEWSDDDLADFTRAGNDLIARRLEDEEDNA
jgi:hypothetical protein